MPEGDARVLTKTDGFRFATKARTPILALRSFVALFVVRLNKRSVAHYRGPRARAGHCFHAMPSKAQHLATCCGYRRCLTFRTLLNTFRRNL